MRLNKKIGIVTAAGSGMGRAGALRFAAEGASVMVVDLDAASADQVVREIQAAGGQARALSGDLCDEGFARRIVTETVEAFGGLDFMWAHAGSVGPAAIEKLDFNAYDAAMNLNLKSALVSTTEAIPHMRRRGGGSVVYTASTSGLIGSPFSPVYSMAKFGIVGMTRALGKRYGKEKIRFNVVCPGSINTPMLRVFVARPDSEKASEVDAETLVSQRGGQNPMGRLAEPEEIANAALFLLSDEASFITGASLAVDGGATA